MIRVKLPFRAKGPILACGADLKGAFALAKDREAFLVDGFGDLGDADNLVEYERAIKKCEKILRIRPKIIACDLHPGYFSTHLAENYTLSPVRYTLCKIQHHEAHIASAIVDNAIKDSIIGVAFDGTGFGSDEHIWGGEFFIGNLKAFKRVAHLEYIPMPGGEIAIREPWRMAASYLYRAFGNRFLNFAESIDRKKLSVLKEMIDKKFNSPLTSSMGRLFDAVGSLILSKKKIAFEAQIPIQLEKYTIASCEDIYDFDINPKSKMLVIDPSKIIKGIIKNLYKGIDRSVISTKFHNTVAGMVVKTCLKLRHKFGINKVALSGGVFQNRYLLNKTSDMLKTKDFNVFTHSKIPTNDAGISIGQIAIASARTICA